MMMCSISFTTSSSPAGRRLPPRCRKVRSTSLRGFNSRRPYPPYPNERNDGRFATSRLQGLDCNTHQMPQPLINDVRSHLPQLQATPLLPLQLQPLVFQGKQALVFSNARVQVSLARGSKLIFSLNEGFCE